MDGKTIANKYDSFNNLIEMILKICEIAQFRATAGSSLLVVKYKPSVLTTLTYLFRFE